MLIKMDFNSDIYKNRMASKINEEKKTKTIQTHCALKASLSLQLSTAFHLTSHNMSSFNNNN